MSDERSLIGSVFERRTPRTTSAPSSRFTGTPGTGFPTAQHRFKSAFARARDEVHTKEDAGSSRHADVPQLAPHRSPTRPPVHSKPILADTDALLGQIRAENAQTIARMSDGEIENGKRAILEQLGEGAGDLLRRVQEARRRRAEKEVELEEKGPRMEDDEGARQTAEDDLDSREYVPLVASPAPRRVSDGLATKPGVLRVKSLDNIGRTAPSPLPVTSSTRPSSRTGRRLRFAEVTPDDVHVYESAPASPKRTIFALPPPPDTKDDSIISLGTFRNDTVPSKRPHPASRPTVTRPEDDDPEEGTPEYIRRWYFPNLPANDPNLAWMKSSSETADPSTPRFDLHGVPIPASISSSIPSHLGLHHHAEGTRAGYTIDDIFLLARSTVPAQRASMLGILAKIAHRLGRQAQQPDNPDESVVFSGQEGELRKRILAAGLAAIDQIGSLGAQAVEVVWECLVEWDESTRQLEGVELTIAPDVVSLLRLDYLLPQITDVLSQAALPSESLAQLLAILHWLSQQSNRVADMITTTPCLVPAILNTFLLTPIPPMEDCILPNPLALQVLITLASASRSNASALLDPADALLRFVTPLPPSSPYSPALATTLLTHTLRFYATLAAYGLYSHIATTASQIFTDLASYILSGLPIHKGVDEPDLESRQLRIEWASLIEAWTVCATDPHATNPPHEILWSQVCALGWVEDVRRLRQGLGDKTSDWSLYTAIWDCESAWLEGCKINGIRGGQDEREEALRTLGGTFATINGAEFRIVQHALEMIQRNLQQREPTNQDGDRILKSLASAGDVLASALRLWLACLPLLNDGTPLSAPPFSLPFSELSALSASLVKHPVWSFPSALGALRLQVYLRPLTRFAVHFHRVSRHIPGTTPQLWIAQALVFLSRLLPGDESYALAMLDTFSLVTPQFVGVDPEGFPQRINMDILRPFFEYTVRPGRDVYVAPLRPTIESISRCSTLRIPSSSSHSARPPDSEDDDASEDLGRTFSAGLPLTRDFLFTPLTHLLRSGTSPVFRALPDDWTASEVDVVRATLLLAYAAREVLIAHGLEEFAPSAAETVFACMRVCMLEHGVGIGGTETEVFRDPTVERTMTRLLAPYTPRGLGGARGGPPAHTLEDASAPYLGPTPFYQFYTDLVALYGAVSFGQPTFAALVVVPLAMHRPVDYRRVLWCGGDGAGGGAGSDGGGAGLGDVVRSVRISVEEVVCTGVEGPDPREYLYPVERDAAVLGAYVAALVAREGGGVEGFLRLVAVHHVACTMWGDLGEEGGWDEADGKRWEETRARMLRTVLVRGEADVVRDLVLYRQRHRSHGPFVGPPTCYLGGEDESAGWREERLSFVRRVMGEGAAERVGALLTQLMLMT